MGCTLCTPHLFTKSTMKLTYKNTVTAAFAGYVILAIVNNFIPLLFVMFQTGYGLHISEITVLVVVNFSIQLLVDLISAKVVDKVGYRPCLLVAHGCIAAGFLLLTVLPECLAPFPGILISVIVYAIGGGVLEVLLSPLVESCPTENKEKTMSMLHSFYCWGHVGVVLLSTLFFRLFGIANWKILAWLWVLLPLANGAVFLKTPIATLIAPGKTGMGIKKLVTNKTFWLLAVMMLCSGASEQAVVQWASAFAEQGLGISKTLGDLVGPMSFAIFMGCSRAFYGKFGHRIDLGKFILFSGVLCLAAYGLAGGAQHPVVNLIGCSLCGLSVGILWPGTFSLAAKALPAGGTAMFALLALTGDFGCLSGPAVVGWVADTAGGDIRVSILTAVGFPVLLVISNLIYQKHARKKVSRE